MNKKLKTPARATLGFRLAGSHSTSSANQLLVVIFLRGGVDGLSVVVPYGDDGYYNNRVLTAIPQPTSGGLKRLTDLNGFFGLHPSLAPFYPFYQRGELGFVHACGSGDVTLSHFAASNTVERGLFQGQGDQTGWLARYLDALPTTGTTPIKAVSIGSLLPASLEGSSCAMAVQSIANLLIKSPFKGGTVGFENSLRRMYTTGGSDLVREAGQQTLVLMDLLRRTPNIASFSPAEYGTDDLGNGLKQIAALAKSDTGLAVACIDQSGYDTHVVQGGTVGVLADCLSGLSRSLSTFVSDIGQEKWNNTKVVVMSEFGRRVRENDGAGTDHGHGNMMMVLGGKGVVGGTVHGKWLGLSGAGIDSIGNLRTTTDYRNVLVEVLTSQVGYGAAKSVFPELAYRSVGICNV